MNIEQIIKNNEGLIKKISLMFYGADYDDLYQAGVLGLLKAYKNYKDNGTCKFSSYAYEYIYGEMYTFINNKNIKVNKDVRKLYSLIEKTRTLLTQKIGKEPSINEISVFLNVDEKLINDAIMAYMDIQSLDNSDNYSLYNTLKVEENLSVDDKILINESLTSLSKAEQDIIRARYYDDLTQSETAKNYV